jgi:hypothetical protein
VAFRIQDLMMDVRPGGLQMANPECTCQVTVKPDVREPEEDHPHPGKGPGVPRDNPACRDTILPSGECPPDRKAFAAELAVLRAELRRDLGQGV